MILPANKAWLIATAEAAKTGGHIFPEMAACEAGLESGHPDPQTGYTMYGQSELAREGNNLFGTKQHEQIGRAHV